ncbi:MAG: alpha/beta hydrolase [Candidatus ainarchaeum sp.]|nr:alpha/beta hydrolase [Candidatus ainarchaeum sp.]
MMKIDLNSIDFSKKFHLLILIIIIIFIFVIISIIYTSIYYKNIEKNSKFKLFKDIPYINYDDFDPYYTSLDIYSPKEFTKDSNYPVIIFVHGGAWSEIIGSKNDRHRYILRGKYFTDNNFIVVNVNYRLSPKVKFPTHVRDVSKSILWVYENIINYGGNNKEIYLMGHSAGGQIVSLISTNEVYLEENGLGLENIKASILLEGVGYDLLLARELKLDSKIIDKYYTLVSFGSSENILKNASSINYIDENKNIPPILLINAERTIFRISKIEAREFYKKLIKNNIYSEHHTILGKSHTTLNKEFGSENDKTAEIVLSFINKFRIV